LKGKARIRRTSRTLLRWWPLRPEGQQDGGLEVKKETHEQTDVRSGRGTAWRKLRRLWAETIRCGDKAVGTGQCDIG